MISKFIYIAIIGLIGIGLAHQEFVGIHDKLILIDSNEGQLLNPEEIQSIKSLADDMHLDFVLLNDEKGLPQEVTTLPAIYFQNTKGRSRYYGRYNNTSRIKNFVRTAKMFHSAGATSMKKDILVWENEKTKIFAPIKLTDLAGKVPENLDAKLFLEETHEAIAGGMRKFQLKDTAEQAKHARSFYFNIYPYLDEWDNLSVTYELFSQYNCIKPISQKMESILPAFPWSERAEGFKQIGQIIEADILKQIESSDLGDAFVAVPKTMGVVSWEALGLALTTEQSAEAQTLTSKIALVKEWTVEQDPLNEDPILIFSFLSPLDNYAGEVKRVEGELTLDDKMSLVEAKGSFTVDIADVTMGAEDFDDSVQNKMLKRALFPKAHFEFVKVEGATDQLADGAIQEVTVLGNFTMMGISIPIKVETIIEPIQVGGVTKLAASCRFQIPLFEKFNVKGPDGPSPAKDILQFYMQFNLIENS